jgi:signal transduction histidine kinase
MTLSLRRRMLLTLLPLLALLAVLGGAGVVLLRDLGGNIDAILRENYDSVVYMERLKEDLERIDSSFTFALAGRESKARQQYQKHWPSFDSWLGKEKGNITLPGEGDLVKKLENLSGRYRKQGDAFYAHKTRQERDRDYFGKKDDGLEDTFKRIKTTADQILDLNQKHMELTSQEARHTARNSLIGFAVGLFVAGLAAGWLAWRNIRAILQPIRAVTQSAQAIGLGNLDQVVPVMGRDELGRLGEAFNTMARQLRHYRQTDYARLLRAQRTAQASIDSFPHPVLVVDPEGLVEMANPAAQRLLGVTGKSAAEREREGGAGAALPWQPPPPLEEPLRIAIKEQRPFLPEGFDQALFFRLQGQGHYFLPRIMPIRDPYGNSLGAAVLLEDITRFQLLDQVKTDLVATVSHELKTPLTSIRLVHHLLLEEKLGPLTPKQIELLVDARDNADRLLNIINKLLDLAKLEQGRQYLEIRPVAADDLLQAADDEAGPRAEDKQVTLSVQVQPDLPPLAADAHRLGHALSNLLDNALTYTERGGAITLAAARDGDRIALTVADNGQGIPPEFLPQVFEKFFRIPGRSKDKGTGLGLAIVREIVQAHGGAITCESKPGAGTTFRLLLPAWREGPS